MRFGFSSGWVNRSPTALGPAAHHFMIGQWPVPPMAAARRARVGYSGTWPTAAAPGTVAPEAELATLRAQAEALRAQLETIAKRVEELEGKK